jgi:hypothetical protein
VVGRVVGRVRWGMEDVEMRDPVKIKTRGRGRLVGWIGLGWIDILWFGKQNKKACWAVYYQGVLRE